MTKSYNVDKNRGMPVYRRQSDQGIVLRNLTGFVTSEDFLWANCPLIGAELDPTVGVLYDEPFTGYDSTNDWTLTQATAGTAAISTTIPGALTLNSGDTTAHHGTNLQRKVAAFVPAANKSIWYEVTVQAHFLTGELFIGLSAAGTTLITAGALGTNDRIGWSSVTGDGILLFNCDKAGVGTTAAAVTLVADTNVTLGFFYDGVADTIQQYINGVATGAVIATANIPKLVVYPSFVCQNSGTDRETLTASALRVFQLR